MFITSNISLGVLKDDTCEIQWIWKYSSLFWLGISLLWFHQLSSVISSTEEACLCPKAVSCHNRLSLSDRNHEPCYLSFDTLICGILDLVDLLRRLHKTSLYVLNSYPNIILYDRLVLLDQIILPFFLLGGPNNRSQIVRLFFGVGNPSSLQSD